MKLPEIIGVAGGNGSGKDTLADLRVDLQRAVKIGVSDILRDEAEARGFEREDRNELSKISAEWTRTYGNLGFLADIAIQRYYELKEEDRNGLSVVSIRRLAEAEVIQQNGGKMIWIEADIEKRYDNAIKRKRGKFISFEEFKANDDLEMYGNPDDPNRPRMIDVKENADILIENDFDSKEDFEEYLKQAYELSA